MDRAGQRIWKGEECIRVIGGKIRKKSTTRKIKTLMGE
jgi:hypothetical protein